MTAVCCPWRAVRSESARMPGRAAPPATATTTADALTSATATAMTNRDATMAFRSVAAGAARVREGLAGDRQELPVPAPGVEPHLEDAEGVGIADEAVRRGCAVEPVERAPAGADHESLDPVRIVALATRVLGRETLVLVVVRLQEHVHPAVVHQLHDVSYGAVRRVVGSA